MDATKSPPIAMQSQIDASDVARKAPPRPLLLGLGAVVVLIALVFGVRYLLFSLSHETTDDARIDADAVTITSKIAERIDKIYVDTNQQVHKGQLLLSLDDRDERARLSQAQAARDAVLAQAQAASVGVALTRDQQRAQDQQGVGGIAQAQAGIASARAQAVAAEQNVAVARASIASAQAQLAAARDGVPAAAQALRKAQADLARTQALVRTGDVAGAELDTARAAEASASAGYAQAQANAVAAAAALDSARRRLDADQASAVASEAAVAAQGAGLTIARGKLAESSTPNHVRSQVATADAASAQVENADAQLRIAKDQLAYTQIVSPIDGFIAEKNVDVGATVAPGQALMYVVPLAGVYVTANYKETQLGRIKVGQPAEITIDAYKGVTFAGHVSAISPASQNTFSLIPATNATGNFVKVTQRVPVRIVFDHPDPKYPLRVGMSVETAVAVK